MSEQESKFYQISTTPNRNIELPEGVIDRWEPEHDELEIVNTVGVGKINLPKSINMQALIESIDDVDSWDSLQSEYGVELEEIHSVNTSERLKEIFENNNIPTEGVNFENLLSDQSLDLETIKRAFDVETYEELLLSYDGEAPTWEEIKNQCTYKPSKEENYTAWKRMIRDIEGGCWLNVESSLNEKTIRLINKTYKEQNNPPWVDSPHEEVSESEWVEFYNHIKPVTWNDIKQRAEESEDILWEDVEEHFAEFIDSLNDPVPLEVWEGVVRTSGADNSFMTKLRVETELEKLTDFFNDYALEDATEEQQEEFDTFVYKLNNSVENADTRDSLIEEYTGEQSTTIGRFIKAAANEHPVIATHVLKPVTGRKTVDEETVKRLVRELNEDRTLNKTIDLPKEVERFCHNEGRRIASRNGNQEILHELEETFGGVDYETVVNSITNSPWMDQLNIDSLDEQVTEEQWNQFRNSIREEEQLELGGYLGITFYTNRNSYPGLHVSLYGPRSDKSSPLTTMHESGKYIIRARDLKRLCSENLDFVQKLNEVGIIEDENPYEGFSVSNIVAKTEFTERFKLSNVFLFLTEGYTLYDSSTFPALIYDGYEEYNTVILLYKSGSVIMPGSNSMDAVDGTFKKFHEELYDFLEEPDLRDQLIIDPDEFDESSLEITSTDLTFETDESE